VPNSEIKKIVLAYLEGRPGHLHTTWEYEKHISYVNNSGIIEFNYMGTRYIALYTRTGPLHKGADDIFNVNYVEPF